jgi:hypothetical protein
MEPLNQAIAGELRARRVFNGPHVHQTCSQIAGDKIASGTNPVQAPTI